MLLNAILGGNMSLLNIDNIKKSYVKKKKQVNVLNNCSASFEKNKFYAIIGASGAGKSTFLKCISLILPIDSGKIILKCKQINHLKERELSEIRLNTVGIIFQEYNLLPYLNAYENVLVPLLLKKDISFEDKKSRTEIILNKVGLTERENHYPDELSGGEQQRVAIARALINEPEIILADEPTGNLDESNKKIIFQLLHDLSRDGKCVIVVSHDKDIKNYADEILVLENGRVIKQ